MSIPGLRVSLFPSTSSPSSLAIYLLGSAVSGLPQPLAEAWSPHLPLTLCILPAQLLQTASQRPTSKQSGLLAASAFILISYTSSA